MIAFWDAVIRPHLTHARPAIVLVAGGGDATLVAHLLDALQPWDGSLHVADPNPGFDIAATRQRAGDRLVVHNANPADTLGLLPVPDLLLLDPDPNYATVQHLLHAAQAQAARLGQSFPVTLLANSFWPHGRRDCYTDPAAIPAFFRHPHEKAGLRPYQARPAASSGLFADRFHASAEHGPRNGVLTALEDFVSAAAGTIAALSLPFHHGLSLIYPRRGADEPGLRILIEGFALGPVARGLAESAELARAAAEAELADLRRAAESERYHTRLLHESLSLAARRPAPPLALTSQDDGPKLPATRRLPARARRLARLALWAARGEVATRRAAESSRQALQAQLARLAESPVLDAAWYLARYPDVASGGAHPAEHYLLHGADEGRDPGPYFSSAFYRQHNPDVAESGVNPLLHYLNDGAREGRDPSPYFSTAYYLESAPDVAQTGLNPLEHYLLNGIAEGRLPRPPI